MLAYELKMIEIAWPIFKKARMTDEELHASIGFMLFEFGMEI